MDRSYGPPQAEKTRESGLGFVQSQAVDLIDRLERLVARAQQRFDPVLVPAPKNAAVGEGPLTRSLAPGIALIANAVARGRVLLDQLESVIDQADV